MESKSEPVYVETFVTFPNYGAGWGLAVWWAPPTGCGPVFRLRVRVPDVLILPPVEGVVVGPIEATKEARHG